MPTILPTNGQFDLLQRALEATGLDAALAAPGADLTLLAPTDDAFVALARSLGYAGTDEDAAFTAIVTALTGLAGGDPLPLLTDILRYHVLDGAQTRAEIKAAVALPTLLAGASLAPFGGTIGDGDPDAADARFAPGGRDFDAGGVLIQPITEVLLPIDVPGNADGLPVLPTIAGLVAASGSGFDDNGADFDLLLAAVQAAGLVTALDDPAADLTVFAPTDAAFLELARSFGFTGDGEQAAFDAIVATLTSLAPGGDPIPLLRDILLYHVVDQRLSQDQADASGPITPLFGGPIEIAGDSIIDADPDVRDARFVPGAGDILAANGVVQAIDRVLLPLDLDTATDGVGGSIAAVLAASGDGFDTNRFDFDILNAALDAAGLTATLDDLTLDLTLFAPTDTAFLRLAREFGFVGRDEAAALDAIVDVLTTAGGGDPIPLLTDILLYHVVDGGLTRGDIRDADSIVTLSGEAIAPDQAMLGDLDPSVGDPRRIGDRADLFAENGVIQAIDGVLLPFDLALI